MKIVIFYRSDFSTDEMWKAVLDQLGVETETVVNGKIVQLEYERVEIAAKVVEVE